MEEEEIDGTEHPIGNKPCPNCGGNMAEEHGKWVCMSCQYELLV